MKELNKNGFLACACFLMALMFVAFLRSQIPVVFSLGVVLGGVWFWFKALGLLVRASGEHMLMRGGIFMVVFLTAAVGLFFVNGFFWLVALGVSVFSGLWTNWKIGKFAGNHAFLVGFLLVCVGAFLPYAEAGVACMCAGFALQAWAWYVFDEERLCNSTR